jgi:hypothetical protein
MGKAHLGVTRVNWNSGNPGDAGIARITRVSVYPGKIKELGI